MTATSVEFDPMNPEFLRDPYPIVRRLRQDAPVHYTDFAGGFWLVTRHADLKTIVRDPSLRCADIEPAGESQRAITTMVRRGFARVPVRFVAG
jgi:cytochrome P450